jgi:hypothetical protein
MSSKNTFAVLSVAALLLAPFGASAAGPATAEEHAAHHPASAASAPMLAPRAAMPAPPEMSAMREMRDKMAAARTPDERQALMAEHMKAMQDGMQMMKRMAPMAGMSGMGDMDGMSGMEPKATMSGKTGKDLKTAKSSRSPKPVTMAMAADMAKHHEMMMGRMDMMQTMMEMMMQRMPVADALGR